jgi:hypothetical protein
MPAIVFESVEQISEECKLRVGPADHQVVDRRDHEGSGRGGREGSERDRDRDRLRAPAQAAARRGSPWRDGRCDVVEHSGRSRPARGSAPEARVPPTQRQFLEANPDVLERVDPIYSDLRQAAFEALGLN